MTTQFKFLQNDKKKLKKRKPKTKADPHRTVFNVLAKNNNHVDEYYSTTENKI